MKSISQSSLDASGSLTRRQLLHSIGLGAVAASLPLTGSAAASSTPKIQGLEDVVGKDTSKGWVPISDRKIRVGLVGYGV
mgnify:FL=1